MKKQYLRFPLFGPVRFLLTIKIFFSLFFIKFYTEVNVQFPFGSIQKIPYVKFVDKKKFDVIKKHISSTL